MEINKRLDEFYTALYQIQDYIRQKDKSWFQIEAQIRKLTFEVEQARNLRSKIPRTWAAANTDAAEEEKIQDNKAETRAENSSEQEIFADKYINGNDNNNSILKKTSLKNVDTGSGEIQLGNVSILINPEEDPDTY